MEPLFGMLPVVLDLLDRLKSKPLSQRQTDMLDKAVARIDKELPHIEAQSGAGLPKFSGPDHEKAVLLLPWELLVQDIEPLRRLPTFRRQSHSLLKSLKAKDGPKACEKLRTLRERLKETLILRGQ